MGGKEAMYMAKMQRRALGQESGLCLSAMGINRRVPAKTVTSPGFYFERLHLAAEWGTSYRRGAGRKEEVIASGSNE